MTETLPKHTILVVDDVPENIDVIYGLLRDKYQIKVALNGELALKIASGDKPPDLILLDIMMPDMDGYEVCKRLRSNPITSDIPVIFVTAKNEREDKIMGFELDAVDYITKPINPDILCSKVKIHLDLYDRFRRMKGNS